MFPDKFLKLGIFVPILYLFRLDKSKSPPLGGMGYNNFKKNQSPGYLLHYSFITQKVLFPYIYNYI